MAEVGALQAPLELALFAGGPSPAVAVPGPN
jgi:hypothetical protein